jgi:hypothetical protein
VGARITGSRRRSHPGSPQPAARTSRGRRPSGLEAGCGLCRPGPRSEGSTSWMRGRGSCATYGRVGLHARRRAGRSGRSAGRSLSCAWAGAGGPAFRAKLVSDRRAGNTRSGCRAGLSQPITRFPATGATLLDHARGYRGSADGQRWMPATSASQLRRRSAPGRPGRVPRSEGSARRLTTTRPARSTIATYTSSSARKVPICRTHALKPSGQNPD